MAATKKPRVWLAIDPRAAVTPVDRPSVRDDLMRLWTYSDDHRKYHTIGGRHHQTWAELHALSDLVEVPATGTLASTNKQ